MKHNILTPKGERYVAEHGNVVVAFRLREPLFSVPGITEADVRQAVQAEVDRLIDLLDAFDDDPDIETIDWDLEPSLGGIQIAGEVDLEADNADWEPSLGWRHHINQSRIGGDPHGFDDLEGEHDGREPEPLEADYAPQMDRRVYGFAINGSGDCEPGDEQLA
ncbi:MAG: hypothetical protein JWQ89_329 [Devosia sp.]|uniref:hypothetical protein n=1 Tax=Devosia sp. TaxID=1871048 RepID=UPI00261E00F6|nr:hypothetical protein [Devosia sp.]MDB5538602.1 hypothetical protein [Devosia sp.]